MLKQPHFASPSDTIERNIVIFIYCLYCMVIVTWAIFPFIGFLLAVSQKDKVKTELGKTHIEKQIKLGAFCFIATIAGVIMAVTAFLLTFKLELNHAYNFLHIPGIIVAIGSCLMFLVSTLVGLSRVIGWRDA